MRNDGRIEQGRGFQRVFAGEERAEEEPACLGKALALFYLSRDFLEMTQPALIERNVPPAEFCTDERELSLCLRLRQRERTPHDVLDAGGIRGDEWGTTTRLSSGWRMDVR